MLVVDPSQTPFYKAISKAVGTVSILDEGGVVFTRIWCGYEVRKTTLACASHDQPPRLMPPLRPIRRCPNR